ncbi:MAG: arginine--tRNA ligase [Acidobacteria bacterium]|jgi:arginyl-tRNA synthetase|nr:arginine--tRNA ligase [Acidobacteriota bacterium]
MILPVHALVKHRLQQTLTESFGIAEADQPSIVIETPPRRALGDLAVPVAFELARRLRKAPRVIAQELAAALGDLPGVVRIDAAANGYLNFFLSRAPFVIARLSGTAASAPLADMGKVIVEHTAINPNKAAHIGHLRNSALGDTLVRLLRFQGRPVEVQNYIDDTGVQVADVVVGFTELEGRDLASVRALADDPDTRFDYYCWDLYAKVTEWYSADKGRLDIRAHAMHAVEEGGTPLAEMAGFVADRIVRCHLRTMARMNVDYDLLTWEGDILRLQFWAKAFEELRALGAVFMQTEGKLAGCWVMKIEEAAEASDAGQNLDAAVDEEADPQREKVIVRSNGTVTYVGKDIANQFWKFGLLGQDFHYRVFDDRNGRPLWATTSTAPTGGPVPPPFGRAAAVFNVIDSRQAYLQQLLKQSLAAMGFPTQAERSIHFAYEMVALSHATARELGYADTESSGKPFVEVSGRKGLGVKADDLIDRLIATATSEVMRRQPELPAEGARVIAEAIAIAAVRYFLVKFSRGKVIAFDIQEALSFEGETGPYVQYAAVRANNIFGKLKERDGVTEGDVVDALPGLDPSALTDGEDADELWGLVLEAARLDEMVDSAVRTLEISQLAKWAFGLAQSFNAFYHRQPILKEERDDVRLWRAAAVAYSRQQLTLALNLMGCQVPLRM